jgi:hypothetical protein
MAAVLRIFGLAHIELEAVVGLGFIKMSHVRISIRSLPYLHNWAPLPSTCGPQHPLYQK